MIAWICESRVGTEGEQCQPGTWRLIFARPCPSCPLGFLFCYCWAAFNSPLRQTVSTTLQLTSHFLPCLFLYLVKLEVHRIVELFAGMSEHTNASLAWHDMNPKYKQTVHLNFCWLLDEWCISESRSRWPHCRIVLVNVHVVCWDAAWVTWQCCGCPGSSRGQGSVLAWVREPFNSPCDPSAPLSQGRCNSIRPFSLSHRLARRLSFSLASFNL